MEKNERQYPVENASFVEFFRENRWKIHMDSHMPPLHFIEAIHHHDAMELGLCLEGSGVFWIDGIEYSFSAPCISLIYPGQLHKAYSIGDAPSQWIFITFQLRDENPRGNCVRWGYAGGISDDSRLVGLVENVVYECQEKKQQYVRCAHSLLETIVLRYEREFQTIPEYTEQRQLLQRLQPVLQYITEHYQQPLSTGKLSAKLFVHDSTLREWFQKALGMSPMEYVHQTRISAACNLLRNSGLSVSQISEAVGYCSISSFNRQFEKLCRCAPRDYRRNVP